MATNWDNIDNFGEGLAAFGAGAGNGTMTAAFGPIGAAAGGLLTGATNAVIAQTGNGVGLDKVNWANVGMQSVVGGASSAIGYGFSQWGTTHLGNAVVGNLNLGKAASTFINGTVTAGFGGGATGFALGLAFTGDIKQASEMGWNGAKSGLVTGGAFAMANFYLNSLANKAQVLKSPLYEEPAPPKNGSTQANRLGQQMHKEYKINEVEEGLRMKEFTLPSGKRIDFIDMENKIIYELKPNNPRAIRQGGKQLNMYRQEVESIYGKGFKTVLDVY